MKVKVKICSRCGKPIFDRGPQARYHVACLALNRREAMRRWREEHADYQTAYMIECRAKEKVNGKDAQKQLADIVVDCGYDMGQVAEELGVSAREAKKRCALLGVPASDPGTGDGVGWSDHSNLLARMRGWR